MRLSLGWAAVWAAVVWVTALCHIAHAQVAGGEFGIERFRLSTDPHGLLDVDSAEVGEQGHYSVGLSIGFAHDPLVVYDSTMAAVDPLVARRLSTDLVGSFALWNRLQLGVGATIVGYQSGTAGLTMDSLPKGGLGDFRLVPKVLLGRQGDVSYAFVPTLTVPGGSASGWLREAGVTFAPAFAISGSREKLRGALEVGYLLRPRTKVAGLVSDDEVFARVGAGYQLAAQTEAWWSTSLAMPVVDANKNQIALEMLLGGRQHVGAMVDVFVAGGIGLDNGFGTPDWRALAGIQLEKARETTAIVPPVIVEKPPVVVVKPPPVVEPLKKAKLTGTVTSTTGQPIASASVSVGGVTLTTDDNGHFETELDAGTFGVAATVDGYDPGSVTVQLAAGAAGDVVVKLQRKVRQGQLRGQVLSFGGQPVLGATITIGDKSVTSDAEGNYSIDLPAGSFDVTIEASGFTTQKRKVSIKLDGVTVLNADLRGAK